MIQKEEQILAHYCMGDIQGQTSAAGGSQNNEFLFVSRNGGPVFGTRDGFFWVHRPYARVTLLLRLFGPLGTARSNEHLGPPTNPADPCSADTSKAHEIGHGDNHRLGSWPHRQPPVRLNLDLQDYRQNRSGRGDISRMHLIFLPSPRMTERQVPNLCYPDLNQYQRQKHPRYLESPSPGHSDAPACAFRRTYFSAPAPHLSPAISSRRTTGAAVVRSARVDWFAMSQSLRVLMQCPGGRRLSSAVGNGDRRRESQDYDHGRNKMGPCDTCARMLRSVSRSGSQRALCYCVTRHLLIPYA